MTHDERDTQVMVEQVIRGRITPHTALHLRRSLMRLADDLRDAARDEVLDALLHAPAGATESRMERLGRNAIATARRRDEAERGAALPPPPGADLRVGDFREVLADVPDGSVDAIICDPPYPHEYLDLLPGLATLADRILTPAGSLAVLFGQTYLPDVYRLLEGGRPYRWTLCYSTHGRRAYVSRVARVASSWKPVLVYGGGPRMADVVTSADDDKAWHHWGQDVSAFTQLIERLTAPGALVCDPFLGAGTTAIAARNVGRRFLGCDTDAGAVATTKLRLADPPAG